MAINLDPTLEARVRAVAAARGEDPNHYATVVLTEAVERDAAVAASGAPDEDDLLSDEECARIDAGIERGLADFAQGRSRPLEQVIADKNARFGLDL
jgi:predicted transcriptional regulator